MTYGNKSKLEDVAFGWLCISKLFATSENVLHKSGFICCQIMAIIGHKINKSESNRWSTNAYIRIPTCFIIYRNCRWPDEHESSFVMMGLSRV